MTVLLTVLCEQEVAKHSIHAGYGLSFDSRRGAKTSDQNVSYQVIELTRYAEKILLAQMSKASQFSKP